MGKGIKCKSRSHQILKDNVEELARMFTDLQSARKENRSADVAVLEEQIKQKLNESQKKLNEPSPASSSQQSGSCKVLQLRAEEDDATSGLAAPKPDPDALDTAAFHNNLVAAEATQEQSLNFTGQSNGSPSGFTTFRAHGTTTGVVGTTESDFFSLDILENCEENYGSEFDMIFANQIAPEFPENINPSACAFLGPKCALWDCLRPAQGWCSDYCSSMHATNAEIEGQYGMKPVVRPKGIELKDNILFAAIFAKTEGKNVGIPECHGAASAKSPWNAPELFDISIFEGETIREWLFFDKPRRAYESGNRRQRSLPDHKGRGWHESRKQEINESSGWRKRSYFMDPQPMKAFDWHLFEYEITIFDTCALYRLELKLVQGKKGAKGKINKNADDNNDCVIDLQQKMKGLSAEFVSK